MLMVAEDSRSTAFKNYAKYYGLKLQYDEQVLQLAESAEEI
jgi:hypothetical protein